MTERLVVRNGLVVDGTGAGRRPGDVLVENGTIAAIGDVADTVDARVVDASGMVVAPGFIDLHTHADYSVLAFPSADSALRQGVTTIGVGNCGGGVAPIGEGHDIRPVSFAYRPDWGIETSWRSFPEYLTVLDGLGVNVAAMVPQGALRNAVMGMDPRPATSTEIETMARQLDEALSAGAVGMSTGLQYRPGSWTPPTEIRRLVETVGRHGGIYATHMRDRTDHYAAAVREAIDASAGTGAHLQLSHVAPRPNAPADEIERAHALMSEAAASDLRFGVDTFPEPWGPALLVDLLPTELMEGDTAQVLSRLADPAIRPRIEAYVDDERSFLARVAGYDDIYLTAVPDRPDLNGVPLAARRPVGAFACDVLLAAGGRLREVGIRHIYADQEAMDAVLALDACSVASDGIVTSGEDGACPLPWNASSYGFTARLLEHYVRGRGLLSLETAVRKLTALPAEALGLTDRGVLAPGRVADVVVFDPAAIADRSTPVHMARHPTGIEAVVVGGAIAAEASGVTGARAGRLVA